MNTIGYRIRRTIRTAMCSSNGSSPPSDVVLFMVGFRQLSDLLFYFSSSEKTKTKLTWSVCLLHCIYWSMKYTIKVLWHSDNDIQLNDSSLKHKPISFSPINKSQLRIEPGGKLLKALLLSLYLFLTFCAGKQFYFVHSTCWILITSDQKVSVNFGVDQFSHSTRWMWNIYDFVNTSWSVTCHNVLTLSRHIHPLSQFLTLSCLESKHG